MVLRIRATFPQSKVFYKIYAVKDEMNLFAFNRFILNDLGFAPDQMVSFEGYDQTGALCSEYGLFDLGDGSMDQVTFASIIAKGEVEVRYLFDMRNDRYIKLVFEGEEPASVLNTYPCLLEEKGHAPDQFSTAYEDYEAVPAPGAPHPVPVDDEDFDDDDDDEDDEDDEEEIFDEDELSPDE